MLHPGICGAAFDCWFHRRPVWAQESPAGGLLVSVFFLWAALSRSTGQLIAMRALMGIAARRLCFNPVHHHRHIPRPQRARTGDCGVAATFALGTGIGPLVGGWLLTHFTWSSVFYINLPVVVIGLVGGYFFIYDSKRRSRAGLMSRMYSSLTGYSRCLRHYPGGISGWTAHNVLIAFGIALVLLTCFVSGNCAPPMRCCR